MKIALLTDTHYGARKGSKIFHDYFQKFYDNIFFPTLEKRKIKHAIHLGDSFDNRKNIDFWALNWAKEHVYDNFKKLNVEVAPRREGDSVANLVDNLSPLIKLEKTSEDMWLDQYNLERSKNYY